MSRPRFQEFLVTGTSTFIVPAGVFRLKYKLCGGGASGGGGAGGNTGTNKAATGGGGGAGAPLVEGELDVIPGEQLDITVAAGGLAAAGGPTSTNGTVGNTSAGPSSIIRHSGPTTLVSASLTLPGGGGRYIAGTSSNSTVHGGSPWIEQANDDSFSSAAGNKFLLINGLRARAHEGGYSYVDTTTSGTSTAGRGGDAATPMLASRGGASGSPGNNDVDTLHLGGGPGGGGGAGAFGDGGDGGDGGIGLNGHGPAGMNGTNGVDAAANTGGGGGGGGGGGSGGGGTGGTAGVGGDSGAGGSGRVQLFWEQ